MTGQGAFTPAAGVAAGVQAGGCSGSAAGSLQLSLPLQPAGKLWSKEPYHLNKPGAHLTYFMITM